MYKVLYLISTRSTLFVPVYQAQKRSWFWRWNENTAENQERPHPTPSTKPENAFTVKIHRGIRRTRSGRAFHMGVVLVSLGTSRTPESGRAALETRVGSHQVTAPSFSRKRRASDTCRGTGLISMCFWEVQTSLTASGMYTMSFSEWCCVCCSGRFEGKAPARTSQFQWHFSGNW